MATSGRYQSFLLNFFARQSLRIRDKSSQTWRQVKLAATWGAQILVYPLYVAFQTTRLAGKQFRQAARQVWPRLQAAQETRQKSAQPSDSSPLTTDTPIQHTLELVQSLSLSLPASRLALEPSPQDAAAPGVLVVAGGELLSLEASSALAAPDCLEIKVVGLKPETSPISGSSALCVRGVASLLTTRSLVLVTLENQVLDILTADQQHHLQQRMSWEMAGYWRQQRVLEQRSTALPPSVWVDRALPLPRERVHALPPIQAFYHLMAWMQTGPVAVAANLFQESQLVLSLPETAPPSALPSLDLPLRSAQASWQSLGQGGSGRFDRSKRPFGLGWMERLWPRSSALVRSELAPPPSSSLAAVRDEAAHPGSAAAPLTLEELSRPAGSGQAQEPFAWQRWLQTMAARFGGSTPQPAARQRQDAIAHHPEAQLARAVEPALQSSQAQARSYNQPIVRTPGSASLQERVNSPDSPASPSAVAPSWIETEAKLVAYEKHPLEQVLEWLDRSILWVEEKVGGLWQWLRDRCWR